MSFFQKEDNIPPKEKVDEDFSSITQGAQLAYHETPSYKSAANAMAIGLFKATVMVGNAGAHATQTVVGGIKNINWDTVGANIEYGRHVTVSTLPRDVSSSLPGFLTAEYSSSFKVRYSLSDRIKMKKEIEVKHPSLIPIVVERSSWSKLPILDKSRFITQPTMTIADLLYIVRTRLKVERSMAVYLTSRGRLLTERSKKIIEVSEDLADEKDGFLYVYYHEENVFG